MAKKKIFIAEKAVAPVESEEGAEEKNKKGRHEKKFIGPH